MAKARIKCMGYWTESTPNAPAEFDCEYEKADFECNECIINCGDMSPVSGKIFRGNRALYEADCRERWGDHFLLPIIQED